VSSALLFDLASAYEQRKDYEKAFRLASEANATVRRHIGYCANQHRERCAALMRTFDADFFAARPDYGNPSRLPVFVLGMPRSGTTLVEQILGGHPDIFVAGEIGIMTPVIQRFNAWERHIGSGLCYPACIHDLTASQCRAFSEKVLAELQAYAPQANHVVDKLPHNFENIGLIRLLFPNAPIIHVLREPRDVAMSNFFADYLAKFSGMGFAYDLADLGRHLRDYQHLMAHWDAVVPKPILTVRYEAVVNDVEAAARAILDYLGLPWTDQVLDYQTLNRAVKTASVWQVRQPIYQTSKGKWQRYQAHLAPLEAALTEPMPSPTPQEKHPPPGLFFVGMEHLQAGRSEQATAVFEAVLRHNPRHAAAKHMLGVALMQQDKPEAALALMQDSIARHGGHPGWHQNLGRVLDALGKHEEAQAAYQAAQTLKQPLAAEFEFSNLQPSLPCRAAHALAKPRSSA
jgi:tetratricopeptide (TPR) repeat protein